MKRSEIKNKAKEMIKGNLWYILTVYIVIYGVSLLVGLVQGILSSIPIISMLAAIASIIVSSALSIGAVYYVLKFARGEKIEIKDFFIFAKENWLLATLTTFLAGLCIVGGYLVLFIPGIIVAIGLSFVNYVIIDNKELDAGAIIKKTWQLTKGHKWEIFVFGLSFMGWAFLSIFTLGLLYIWLLPYMSVSSALLYEELKKKQSNNN